MNTLLLNGLIAVAIILVGLALYLIGLVVMAMTWRLRLYCLAFMIAAIAAAIAFNVYFPDVNFGPRHYRGFYHPGYRH